MNLPLLSEYITPSTILDIGANVGHWYREANAVWPDARFLLLEGNPECREMLEASGGEFAIVLLSDGIKWVQFYTRNGSPACTGASIYREATPFYEGENALPVQLPTLRLDFVANGRPFDLIKIDVQGSELDIMRGGDKTFRAARAIVAEVSYSDYNAGAPKADEVSAHLATLGFVPKIELGKITHPLHPDQHIQSDVLFMRP